MKNKNIIFYLCYFLLGSLLAQDPSHALWYKQAAKQWMTEALPIGNGRLGGMIFGGINQERIQLNVDSLWTGHERYTGSYQSLGNLYITFAQKTPATDYKRTLDLRQAVHKVEYKVDGKPHTRECFSSAADQVIVLHINGNKMTGRIKLEDDLKKNKYQRDKKSRQESAVKTSGQTILIQGRLVNDLRYATQLQAKCTGGSITVSGNELIFTDVDELSILIAAETNYVMDMSKNWRGEDPLLKVQRTIKLAQSKNIEQLRADHQQEYSAFYQRFTLDIGNSPIERATLATDERLKLFQQDKETGDDPDVRELIVNYARYLLISSSRPGCLPANLQGLWCDSNSPPWRSDYHSNINFQMNYWFALPMNLADCHQNFVDYVMAMREVRVKDKKVSNANGGFHTKGWAVRTENGIHGGTGWKWNMPGVAWYAQHLYEQYAFTLDRNVLKNQAYVVLKETCEFWEERLIKRADGTLVVPNGWSPE
ncbi:MAG: glycoside hydrolase family 95 protein, partial [Lentisphaeraceae bacterium]|nr:glycoside hydrolase family 95 protein [Lentisphaeraceae bacterium]